MWVIQNNWTKSIVPHKQLCDVITLPLYRKKGIPILVLRLCEITASRPFFEYCRRRHGATGTAWSFDRHGVFLPHGDTRILCQRYGLLYWERVLSTIVIRLKQKLENRNNPGWYCIDNCMRSTNPRNVWKVFRTNKGVYWFKRDERTHSTELLAFLFTWQSFRRPCSGPIDPRLRRKLAGLTRSQTIFVHIWCTHLASTLIQTNLRSIRNGPNQTLVSGGVSAEVFVLIVKALHCRWSCSGEWMVVHPWWSRSSRALLQHNQTGCVGVLRELRGGESCQWMAVKLPNQLVTLVIWWFLAAFQECLSVVKAKLEPFFSEERNNLAKRLAGESPQVNPGWGGNL